MTPSSPSNFQLIIDAFDDNAKQLGVDLTNNPYAETLRACDSPNAILELLQEKAHAFKDYWDGDQKLISWLKPVVQVVHDFSAVLGQAIRLVPFPPASVIFVSVDSLLTVRTPSCSPPSLS
ncbi:hypothetical protein EI94DRAFT_1810365 [Lactarius quietus]|nr:hypothetical protein EI94DRAFT_1810365 [Lactarius quietus]